MNYFEFYGGDYARDTAHLSLAEHGAFLLLLSAYYSTEKPLPADAGALYRIARAMNPSEQKAVRGVADQFFPVGEDGLRHNARADREVEKARHRIETARGNGKRGGRPPKQEPKENPPGLDSVAKQEPNGKAPHAPHAIPTTDSYSEGARDERAAPSEWGSFEGHSHPVPTLNPVAPFAIALTRAGFSCTSINPDLIAYQEAGGTVAHLSEVARHHDCAGKNATYVIRFARRELTTTAKPVYGANHETSRKLSASEQTRADIAARRRLAEPADVVG